MKLDRPLITRDDGSKAPIMAQRFSSYPLWWWFAMVIIGVAGSFAIASNARAQTFGVNLVARHDFNTELVVQMKSVTPGAYIVTESGYIAGVMRNSLGRLGIHGGKVFSDIAGSGLDMSAEAVYGYQRRKVDVPCERIGMQSVWTECFVWDTGVKTTITGIATVSHRFDSIKLFGMSPRIGALIPVGRGTGLVTYLSIEGKL